MSWKQWASWSKGFVVGGVIGAILYIIAAGYMYQSAKQCSQLADIGMCGLGAAWVIDIGWVIIVVGILVGAIIGFVYGRVKGNNSS